MRPELAVAKLTQPKKSQRLAADKAEYDNAHRLNRSPFKHRAQSADESVDAVGSRIEAVAPHIWEQRITGAHRPSKQHEMPQEEELAMRQRDLAVCQGEPPGVRVEPHPTRLEPSRRRRCGS